MKRGYKGNPGYGGPSGFPYHSYYCHDSQCFYGVVNESLNAGMNAHLSKPIVMEEVVKTIARNIS